MLMQGFAVAGTPENLMIALIGCFIGTVVGLLPGLGPINGDRKSTRLNSSH